MNTLIRVTHVCSSRVTENSTNAVGHFCLLFSFRVISLYWNYLFNLDLFLCIWGKETLFQFSLLWRKYRIFLFTRTKVLKSGCWTTLRYPCRKLFTPSYHLIYNISFFPCIFIVLCYSGCTGCFVIPTASCFFILAPAAFPPLLYGEHVLFLLVGKNAAPWHPCYLILIMCRISSSWNKTGVVIYCCSIIVCGGFCWSSRSLNHVS